MAKLSWRTIGWVTLAALPMAATAQFTFNETTDPGDAPHNVLGGVPAFDLIRLDGLGPGIPLRKGNVIQGSERVQLDSQQLRAGPDYGMDYVSGVVYLKRAIRPGMALTVFYRYDDKAPQPSPDRINGITAKRFDLIPGQFGVIAGMGMAERSADGNTVATSNLFGFNSNLSVGGSSLKGIFLFSEKKRVDSQQLMGYQGAAAPMPAGKSSLILQNFSSKMGKGSFNANYQDVSSNFTDFGAALAAGYDAKVVDQLAKEKGLKRLGFGFTDLQVGSMSISQSFKMVGNGTSDLEWKSLGVKQGGLSLAYNAQHVGRTFNRFNDLAEADRAQLARETGMDRQSLSADFTQKFGKLSFTANEIRDGAGSSIQRRVFALDSSKFKFTLGDQIVGQNFSRIASVLPEERALYGAELGVHRQWMALDASMAKDMPLHLAMIDLSTSAGGFHGSDFAVSGKTWSLEHSARAADPSFNGFGALNAEVDNHLRAIGNMYQKDPIAMRPQDKSIFLSTPGIDREFTRLSLTPKGGFSIMAQHLEIKTPTSNSFLNVASLVAKHFAFNYRQQKLGVGLDPNSLMLFERDRLGSLPGLSRTDMSLSMDLGGARTLSITKTDASTGQDSMSRQTAQYHDKNLDIQAGMRNVSPGFALINQLIDPEKDMLPGLIGFREQDVKVTWQILPTLKFEGYSFDANSDALSQQKRIRNLLVDWKPDKRTALNYTHLENHSNDPNTILFANALDRFSFFKDMGKLGKISYVREKQSFDGTQTQQPDSDKQSIAYEAQLDKRTSVRTEETTTQYDNGDKEQTSANTISTSLTKQLGVSVSDVNINRPGSDHDEKKRNYGFWLDFGHGLRFNYGYARQLTGDLGTSQTQASLSGGDIGGWHFGDAGFNQNTWDRDGRVQATTKFAIGTIKPITLGFLKDVSLNLGWDTAADRSIWLRENKIFSFAGKLAGNQIGFDYHSQILANNQRGIDRVFAIRTDPNEKKWLRANVFYKVRTMPDGSQIMIRNMAFTARLTKGVELTNSVLTNPEQPNGGVLLGSVPLADRKNSWKLEYKPTSAQDPYKNRVTWGANWDELINDQRGTLTRTGGATFKIDFANGRNVKPDDPVHSSLSLFYGIEQNDTTSRRKLAQRYSLQYDQRPGANQEFNFLIGNISYEHSIEDGFHRDNWTIRCNYQFKF